MPKLHIHLVVLGINMVCNPIVKEPILCPGASFLISRGVYGNHIGIGVIQHIREFLRFPKSPHKSVIRKARIAAHIFINGLGAVAVPPAVKGRKKHHLGIRCNMCRALLVTAHTLIQQNSTAGLAKNSAALSHVNGHFFDFFERFCTPITLTGRIQQF